MPAPRRSPCYLPPLAVALLLVLTPLASAATPYAGLVGVDVGGINEREMALIDLARTLRPWEVLEADACPEDDQACRLAPLDESGNPVSDARTVFFDVRPFGAWWSDDQANCPLCADGSFQQDLSGVYALRFEGQAVLGAAEGAVSVERQRYDQASNITTADIVVGEGQGLLFMTFSGTRRTPDSPLGSGIANLRLIRPGFAADTPETFNPAFLETLAPFAVLRFMNWTGGNNINPSYGDEDNTLEWSERVLPGQRLRQQEGVPWEYLVEVINRTRKDLWLNVPVHASDDYVTELARLLEDTLHQDAHIYVEYSNEVWNFLFSQASYNQLAAQDEVLNNPDSPLALNAPADSELDGQPYNDLWRRRRHVKRLVEIAELFREVFGLRVFEQRVRVVNSWQIDFRPVGVQYREQLEWVETVYGEPSRYFYALGGASYFNNEPRLLGGSFRKREK